MVNDTRSFSSKYLPIADTSLSIGDYYLYANLFRITDATICKPS